MIRLTLASRFSDCEVHSIDSPLHEAAFVGDVDRLKELLSLPKFQEMVNKRNHLGCTPLRLGATGGHLSCVRELLKAGGSVDLADVKGQTPLFVAVKNGHVDCAQLLLEHGASAEGDLDNIASPLYTAAMNGSVELVKLLLDFGAQLHAAGRPFRLSRTFRICMDPLQISLVYHQYECLKLLLYAGANPNFSNLQGEVNMYHIAIKQKCSLAFFKLLYEFGTEPFVRDAMGCFPWDVEMPLSNSEAEVIGVYLQSIRDKPRSLQSTCRLVIRHCLGTRSLGSLASLSLPKSLVSYLRYDDL